MFYHQKSLEILPRRCKRLLWRAVLLVFVEEIFFLQQICSIRVHIYLLFVCPAWWFLPGDEGSSLHLRSSFGPIQQLQLLQTVKQRRIWCLDYFKVYSCLFWSCQEKDRAGSWGSKPLPGSILRNPRRCCNWFHISGFPYLAHILAWHPKLVLSNLLHLLQLKTHLLAPLSPASP